YKLGDTLEILTKSEEGSWCCIFRLGEARGLMEEADINSDRTFTLYKIYNSNRGRMPTVEDEKLRRFLSESFNLHLLKGLRIIVNGKRAEAVGPEGKVIPFRWLDAYGEFFLTRKPTKFSFYVREVKVSDMVLHGVGGWVNCDKLQVSTNRENLVEDETYYGLVKRLESRLREEARGLRDEDFKDYREILIRVALNLRDKRIAARIPILTDKGLKKLGKVRKVAFEEGEYTGQVDVIASSNPYILELIDLLHIPIVTSWKIEDLEKYISGKIRREVKSIAKEMLKVVKEAFPDLKPNSKPTVEMVVEQMLGKKRMGKGSGKEKNREGRQRKRVGIRSYFKLAGLKWRFVGFGEKPISLRGDEVLVNVESDAVKLAVEKLRGKASKIILSYLLRKPLLKTCGLDEGDPRFQEYMNEIFFKAIERIAEK
ncbi:MAG: hypothetical protein ACE5Z5_08675, partial [Candidatus Bathyarchaeia archaeon]